MDDNDVCPLCCEELDLSDRQFFPCKCGYQVCMWCWHRIRESESGLCPACRTPYGDDPHEFSAVDLEDVLKANKEKAAAEKRERERLRQQAAAASGNAASSAGASAGSFGSGGGAAAGLGGMHIGGGSDGDLALTMGGAGSSGLARGIIEPPKDRNQLANMRVIRRNLVYAVGLPPSIATEETLRRPEYFGQYGKISKIVINRSHTGNGDPRRASASAYVTFVQKEDTLACILALDGFYHDGRNIRASYGTSKYCSAFIKNVRCNNPDCTYLHCMGETEDTFTKQEIQAGYVTSGRDVLARQQQIMAEAQASTGGVGAGRKKVGGGGPSGTGRAAANPTFPPPTFDEPLKSTPSAGASAFANVGHSSYGRSSSMGTPDFSSVAAAGKGSSAVAVVAGKASRSVSLSLPSATAGTMNSASVAAPPSTSNIPLKSSKGIAGGGGVGAPASLGPTGASSGPTLPATAASVVAGVHQPNSSVSGTAAQPPPHTTLTPLTPLKRASSLQAKSSAKGGSIAPSLPTAPSVQTSETAVDNVQLPPNMPVPRGLTPAEQAALLEQRKEAMAAMARQQREMAMKLSALRSGTANSSGGSQQQSGYVSSAGTAASSPSSSVSSASGPSIPALKTVAPGRDNGSKGAGVIGGIVLGSSNAKTGPPGVVGAGAVGSSVGRRPPKSGLEGVSLGAVGSGVSSNIGVAGLASSPLDLGSIGGTGGDISALGGQAIGGLKNNSSSSHNQDISGNTFALHPPPSSAVGAESADKWGAAAHNHSGNVGLFGNSGAYGISGGGIWGSETSNSAPGSAAIENSTNGVSGLHHAGVVGGTVRNGELGRSGAVDAIGSNSSNGAVGGENLLGKNAFSSSLSGENSGSSALASMLGIELPTGSGSLREASSLWGSSSGQLPVGGLNAGGSTPGPIGSGPKHVAAPLGGQPIRGGTAPGMPVGGFGSVNSSHAGGSNTSDIALLQSLLPGVHITSGNAHQPAAPARNSGSGTAVVGGEWGSLSSPPPASRPQPVGVNVGSLGHGSGETWGGLYSVGPGVPVGGATNTRGGTQQQQQQQQQQRSSIW